MVIFQRFAQGQQPATNPGLDGAERLADCAGDFLMRSSHERKRVAVHGLLLWQTVQRDRASGGEFVPFRLSRAVDFLDFQRRHLAFKRRVGGVATRARSGADPTPVRAPS